MVSNLDFGYPWWISYGHLIPVGIALLLWFAGTRFRWPRVAMILIAGFGIWSIAAFAVARFALNVNGRASLPTEKFLTSGAGRVLDIGAGTGRSALMVLEARPQTKVVALDLFEDSYREHFGNVENGPAKLLSNVKAAGQDSSRVEVRAGDMRSLPFGDATFDAAVTSYAIDHIGSDGAVKAISEAFRVLKPGGEFLVMVVAKDKWLNLAFGPFLLHSGLRGSAWWTQHLQEGGFRVEETGLRPGTLYLLARKP
jgi:SAM-dependent methyltransferase